jgi:hypothetical protein
LRKASVVISLLLITAGFICAQEFGVIRGKIADKDGVPLPGVSITLTGSKTAPRSVLNSATALEQQLNLETPSTFGQTRRILNPRVFRVGF